MGLSKLNPFKKSSQPKSGDANFLSPNDGLQPTKSTSSVAGSIRSIGDKAEKFISDGPKPRENFKKDEPVEASRLFPTTSTGGGAANPAIAGR